MASMELPVKETPEGGYEGAAKLTRFIQVRGRFTEDGYVITAIKSDGPGTRIVGPDGKMTFLDPADVIVEVDGLKIQSQADYATAMNRAKNPKRIEMKIRDCNTGKIFTWYLDSVDSPFFEFAGITDDMELDEAIAISRRFPLETLLRNFQSKREGFVLSHSAHEVLAECSDPQTMPRMLELLSQDLKSGSSSWLSPIALRLKNKTLLQSEKQLVVSALMRAVNIEPIQGDLEPVAGKALGMLSEIQPLSSEVVGYCSKKLDHPHYYVASSALRVLINLPVNERSQWVPLLLKQLHSRFSKDSEATWIIECLTPHFSSHRKQIVPVLRMCLKSEDAFVPTFVLELLCRLGSAASEFVPDILEYLSQQKAYSNQEPYLIHVDPEGTVAIPGLIELLGNTSRYVNYQATTELEAYGARAQSAVPDLTRLAKGKGKDKKYAATAAQRALLAIENGGRAVPEKLSQTERLFGVMEDVITDSPEEK